jgi:steroid 5-alpha reductase family enzyme
MFLNIGPGHLMSTFVTIMIITAILCFLIGELTSNFSQVDKIWSLMPIIYSLTALTQYSSTRLWIMSSLVIIWGLRLSFNFYRKGGYDLIPWKGEEDYRWKIMRQHPMLKGKIRFGLFNLVFISFYQNFLIFLFCTPLLIAAKYQNSDLTITDIIAGTFMAVFIVIESIADNQQFRFQKLKRQGDNSTGLFERSLRHGFLSEGLWSYARHPNYASEQAIWICFYFFGSAASGKLVNWTIAGPLFLIFLFLGSTKLTESISSSKYHDYPAYIKEVPKFIPRFFKSGRSTTFL